MFHAGLVPETNTGYIVSEVEKKIDVDTYIVTEDSDINLNREPLEKNPVKNKALYGSYDLVIDIHGCKREHGFDIDIGTIDDISHAEQFVQVMKEFGLDARNNEKFNGASEETLTLFCERNGIKAVHIEISSSLRTPEVDKRVIDSIIEIVRRFNNGIISWE